MEHGQAFHSQCVGMFAVSAVPCIVECSLCVYEYRVSVFIGNRCPASITQFVVVVVDVLSCQLRVSVIRGMYVV